MAALTAPQVYNAAAVSADLRLSKILQAQLHMALTDMASIRQLISYVGDLSGSGSDSIAVRYLDVGKIPLASAVDGADVAASNMDVTAATVTLGRSALRYDISDLLVLTGTGQDLDPFLLADRLAHAAEARMSAIICSTFDSATTSVGSSGVQLSMDDFLDAVYALQLANNNTPFKCVLANAQFNHLQAALRTENNNFLAFSANTEEMSKSKPQGYCGALLGVEVYKSSYVQLDGSTLNRVGAMFSSDGIGWATGTPQALVDGASVQPSTLVRVEMSRDSSKGLSEIIATMYAGASILEDDRIVKIVTKKN